MDTPGGGPRPAPSRRAWVPWAVVFLCAALWSAGHARHNYAQHAFHYAGTWALYDEGSQALMPLLIVRGKTPYADFEPRHTPLGYYLFAGALKLFGQDLYSIRLVMVAINVATALVAFGFARACGAGRWAYLAPLGTLLWGTTENMVAVPRWLAVPVSLGVCWFLTRRAPAPPLRDVILAGFGCGVAFLISQNTGIITLAAVVWALCLWRLAAREAGGPPWTAAVPVLGAAIASFVLARMVWAVGPGAAALRAAGHHSGQGLPDWFVLAGPSLAMAVGAATVATVRAAPARQAATRLLAHLCVVGVAALVPVALAFLYYVAVGGWQPIVTSLQANYTGLAAIYTLPPPAPPVLGVAILAGWLGIAVVFALPLRTPNTRGIGFAVVVALLWLTVAGLLAFWKPPADGGTVARVVARADELLTWKWLYLLWAVGPAVAGIGVADLVRARTEPLSREGAAQLMAGLAATAGWTVMYPWADYHHALWAAPYAAVAFAVLVRRFTAAARMRWSNLPHWPVSRWALWTGAAALPVAVALAMVVKWGTYWFDVNASLHEGRFVAREFRLLDPERGRVYVDAETADEWGQVLRYVRAHTTPDEPVLGLPYLPLVYVLADRPLPLYDPFWHPDFDAAVRGGQRALLLDVLRSGRVPLIVGAVSDDTYFSLPVLQLDWPDVWKAIDARYERTHVFGRYWILERRQAGA